MATRTTTNYGAEKWHAMVEADEAIKLMVYDGAVVITGRTEDRLIPQASDEEMKRWLKETWGVEVGTPWDNDRLRTIGMIPVYLLVTPSERIEFKLRWNV